MEGHAIHLLLDGVDDFWMAMAQRENSKPAQAVNELASRNITQDAAFAEPFDHRAFDSPGIGPTIQIGIEVLDSFPDQLVRLLRREIVCEVEVHCLTLSPQLLQRVAVLSHIERGPSRQREQNQHRYHDIDGSLLRADLIKNCYPERGP